MLQTNVRLVVVPDEVELTKLANASPDIVGEVYSTPDRLNANKVQDGYTVLYNDDDITDMNPSDLVQAIVGMFKTNLPDYKISISINYCFRYIDESLEDEFDSEVATMILRIASSFMMIQDPQIQYYNSSDVMSVRQILENIRRNREEEVEESPVDDDDNEINRYLREFGRDYDDDDDDEPRRKKSRRKNYGHSRVMSHANKPKQAFKRHGVLVADSKDDISRDKQIIKAFLKDFIPGDAEWKRDFRREVLKRWVDLYVISKKNLKRMEKQHKKAKRSKKSSVEKSMAMDFARRVLSVQQDRWNDPTK